jgi:hypothetical protein
MGISKKMFMNSTLLGTTTGFTFPFLAIYYNFKNVTILYTVVIVAAVFMLNSRHSIVVPEGMGNLASKPSIFQERAILPPSTELLTKVEYVPIVESPVLVEEVIEIPQAQDEDIALFGEYFDSLYMEEINHEEVEDVSKVEDVASLAVVDPYEQSLIFRKEGNYVKALEGFMSLLKGAATFDQEYNSCINIAAIYKEIGQLKQAENVLYCFVQQHREALQGQQIEEIANILKS